jgi:hypothetical protein
MSANRTLLTSAGVVLVVLSLGFIAVFSYLAATFGYPDVLDRQASEVLPLLAAGGRTLRNVWFLYAGLPLGLVFAAAASGSVLRRGGVRLEKFGMGAGVTAGIAMILGLVRWPTLEWALAEHWLSGDASGRAAISAVFDASNLYLGTFIGEFVGETATAAWFVALSVAYRRDARPVVAWLAMGAGLVVFVAAFRNMTSAVSVVSEINNLTLPLWLITQGVLFVLAARVPEKAV